MRSPEGVEFDNTHDHYLRHAAINDANFKAAVEHMTEHGHKPPLVCLASKLDAADFQSLTGWLDPTWEGIVYMAATDRATLKGIEDYHGAVVIPDVGVVFVRFMERIPTGYYSIFKPYGVGSQKNPLRMRIDPLKGFGWSIVPGQYVNSPLNLAVLRAEWGVGIGEDRTNGVFVEVDAAGDYASPTIS